MKSGCPTIIRTRASSFLICPAAVRCLGSCPRGRKLRLYIPFRQNDCWRPDSAIGRRRLRLLIEPGLLADACLSYASRGARVCARCCRNSSSWRDVPSTRFFREDGDNWYRRGTQPSKRVLKKDSTSHRKEGHPPAGGLFFRSSPPLAEKEFYVFSDNPEECGSTRARRYRM